MTDSRDDRQLRILNSECRRFSKREINEIEKLGLVTHVNADRRYLLQNIENYDVLLIALGNTIDSEILKLATNLKYIVTPTTGHNHIDCDYAEQKGIEIVSLRGETKFLENITATAELTWGLLLSLIRHIPQAHQDVLSGGWSRDKYYGNELRGKVLGILGYGRLGKMVARYGQAFGMSVLVYDKNVSPDAVNVEFLELDEILARADIVTVHLPLNQSTNGILGSKFFQNIKEGAFFLNTARGEILDDESLIAALKEGRVAAAAMDVLPDEVSLHEDWLKNSKLAIYARDNKNLIITPHIGGVTYESVEQTNAFIIQKLKYCLRDRKFL